MDEWVVEIEGRLENPDNSHATRCPIMDSDSSNSEEEPSIIGNWQCWNDFGASFIPQNRKWCYVACMRHWFGLNVKSYLEYMEGKVDLAWSYYHGVDQQFRIAENNKRFIEHLLVNSCFLIFVMVYLPNGEYRKVMDDKMDDQTSFTKGLTSKGCRKVLNFIIKAPEKMQDYMLTMNYQIPWFVLKAVYKLSNIGDSSMLLTTPIHNLALQCFPTNPRVHTSKENGSTIIPEGGFKHLLHIFHWSRVPDGKYLVDTNSHPWIGHFWIPSATELQLSEIAFEKYEGGSIDVSSADNRVIKLPPWHLSQYSTIFYEGLLRFEREYYHCGLPFTAYIILMASLLKTEADVTLFREIGVLPGTAFDKKGVLRCVRQLRISITDSLYMPNELFNLKEKVNAHYRTSSYRVYRDFKRRYCVTISINAGILLFVLTFIQTVYSVLSYKKQ